MLFAHGPGGLLATFGSKKWWEDGLPSKTKKRLYLAAILFGLGVDFDMAYVWFFDAQISHHHFITHTPIFHIVVALLIAGLSFVFKKKIGYAIAKVYLVAALSHLVLDTIPSSIKWLYPLSNESFGLRGIEFFGKGFFSQYIIFTNYGIEITLSIASLYVLYLVLGAKKTKKQQIYGGVAASIVAVILASGLWLHAKDTYTVIPSSLSSDLDNDGETNVLDNDKDGDGINNLLDPDSDNDGVSNRDTILREVDKIKGVKYDPTNGSLYEFTKRMGFFNEKDILDKSLRTAGVNLKQEMNEAYKENPVGYKGMPEDAQFDHDVHNYHQLFINTGLNIDTVDAEPGDLVFFGYAKDDIRNSGVITEVIGSEFIVLYINENNRADEYPVSQISKESGPVQTVVRLP